MTAVASIKRWDDLALAILKACDIDGSKVCGMTFTYRVGELPSVTVEYRAPKVTDDGAFDVGEHSVRFVPEDSP